MSEVEAFENKDVQMCYQDKRHSLPADSPETFTKEQLLLIADHYSVVVVGDEGSF